MMNNAGLGYDVDIVMCIDATASMGPFLDLVKSQALNLYGDITEKMAAKDKHIDSLRVRVIAFRDYLADKEEAMLVSGFVKLPEQASEFEMLVNCIKPMGGDNPEDGQESVEMGGRRYQTCVADPGEEHSSGSCLFRDCPCCPLSGSEEKSGGCKHSQRHKSTTRRIFLLMM